MPFEHHASLVRTPGLPSTIVTIAAVLVVVVVAILDVEVDAVVETVGKTAGLLHAISSEVLHASVIPPKQHCDAPPGR
jgi:hypothetical protein